MGINLIGKPEMCSENFHYGDMLIPLVAIATFENLQKYKEKNFGFRKELDFGRDFSSLHLIQHASVIESGIGTIFSK